MDLLNVFVVPLSQSYHEEIAQAKTLFDEAEAIPGDYSSAHNALKDEVFLYFLKQITPSNPDKFAPKTLHSYLLGLSVFTRYFCPSPKFIYPFTNYIYALHKKAISTNTSEVLVNLLDSVVGNLLHFIEAFEGFKRNTVKAFAVEKDKVPLQKTEVECAGYMHARKSPLNIHDMNNPDITKKPEPPTVTIWLVNNESFTYPVRNEIVRTIKRKMLNEIGYLNREQCFSLYFLEPNYSYTLIDDKEKMLSIMPLLDSYNYAETKIRHPIYLRINHYFPFMLKDLNTTRLVYLNMISDELDMPWKPEQYEFLVAQSMVY